MKPKIRCLSFYTYLPPWRIDIFNEMDKMYDLTIVFLHINADGFKYNSTELIRRLKSKVIVWNLGFRIFNFLIRIGIYYLVSRHKPEVVFTHEFGPTSYLLALYKKLGIFKYKLIVSTSDNYLIVQRHSKFKRIIRDFILINADGMIVYTDDVRMLYARSHPKLKIEVCPNIQNPESLIALNSSRVSIRLPKNFILFIGRLEHEKGLDILIEAFKNVEDINLRLLIVGKGSLYNKYFELVQSLGIEHRVMFIQELYGAELFQLYTKARFLVLPSRWEPFGAVVNEALVFGCPVLLSDKAGAKVFIKEGFNGLLTNPTDREAFNLDLQRMLVNFANRTSQNLMVKDFETSVKAFENILFE